MTGSANSQPISTVHLSFGITTELRYNYSPVTDGNVFSIHFSDYVFVIFHYTMTVEGLYHMNVAFEYADVRRSAKRRHRVTIGSTKRRW